MNKYHSTIEVEFRDLIDNILGSRRKTFHIYTIHRLLSLGLLIDFPFKYLQSDEPNWVGIELDLKTYGKVRFVLNSADDSGQIADEASKQSMQNFLDNFKTGVVGMEKRKRFFEK
jgi:hypothetical protein